MVKPKTGAYYAGISGLVLPIPKYKFPEEFQQSSRLTYYASQFNSIEINRSFYVLPTGKTLAKWSREVPAGFKFTFKLWKEITHSRHLKFEDSDVKKFMAAIHHVGEKKGCLLVQFPASIKNMHMPDVEYLLGVLKACDPDQAWDIALEFRDTSWYNDDTYELAESHNACMVIHDKSGSASPHLTGRSNSVYVRFHGPQGDYRGTYSDAFLEEYAGYISEWLEEGKSVYVYFNNTMGDAFANLKTLNKKVDALMAE